jgi:hypothetical protein
MLWDIPSRQETAMDVIINAAPLEGYIILTGDVTATVNIIPASVGVFDSDLINQTPQLTLSTE